MTASNQISKYTQLITQLKVENEELKTLLSKNQGQEKELITDESHGLLLNEDQKRKVEEMERMIFQQFQDEHESKIKLYTCEDNIDSVKQTIARS